MNKKNNLNNVKTFGCRLNALESDVIQKHINKHNLDNIHVVNTCSVTNESERQAKQFIRKLSKVSPSKEIIVTGCASQIDPEKWLNIPEVSKVIGNIEKLKSTSWKNLNEFSLLTQDIMKNDKQVSFKYNKDIERKRAFLQIQQGCDHRCTFCIIPFGRGNSFSFNLTKIIKDCENLVNNGFKEIVLTGVDLTSWGNDFTDKPSLGFLVKNILKKVKNLRRLRLSSLDPAEIDDDLLLLLQEEERLMPHIHLSIQHGADIILKRMKRRHLSKTLYNITEKIKIRRPDVVFGADFISGFPTETDDNHNFLLKTIDELDICWGHVFPFSPRNGTPAAKMPQVDNFTKKIRSKQVREACDKNSRQWLDNQIGNYANVLVENENFGYSEHYARVKIINEVSNGSIQKVKIIRRDGKNLIGTIKI